MKNKLTQINTGRNLDKILACKGCGVCRCRVTKKPLRVEMLEYERRPLLTAILCYVLLLFLSNFKYKYMNINELKIGNLFVNFEGKIFSWGCDDFAILWKNQGLEVDELILSPIKLTKEWLLKFGFKRRFELDDCNLYDFENYKELTKAGINRGQGFLCLADFIEKEGFWIDLQSRATLKYVHQLQNLFAATTGVDLQLSST